MKPLHFDNRPTPYPVMLGTGPFGTGVDQPASFQILDTYLQGGGNFLDTAHVYGAWAPGQEGASEKTIAEWLKAQGTREQVLICTKGGHPDFSTGELRLSREDVRQQFAESLERLQVDSVELYLLHRDNPEVPVGEMVDWLDELVQEGRTMAVGVSNWTTNRIQAAQDYAAKHGRTPLTVNELGWSYAQRTPAQFTNRFGTCYFMDAETLEWHRESQLPALGYTAQANGFFGPKCAPDAPDRKEVPPFDSEANFARRAAALEVAAGRNVSANAIALAWLRHQGFAAYPIAGPKTVAQTADAIVAGQIELTDEELQRLGRSGA